MLWGTKERGLGICYLVGPDSQCGPPPLFEGGEMPSTSTMGTYGESGMLHFVMWGLWGIIVAKDELREWRVKNRYNV